MNANKRVEKIAELIQRNLANIIQHEMRNPILSNYLITIGRVLISPDLKYAKVYFTILQLNNTEAQSATLPNIENSVEIGSVLSKSSSFLKRQLANRLDLRVVPSLRFIYDNSINHTFKIRSLLQDYL